MSGGRLVVLERSGRDGKRYPLASGFVTLGSNPACDIRVMLASVCPHHATVAVHTSQTVIQNVGDGETLVNGQSISVAALRHGDMITLGDRSLRWEYSAPSKRQQASPGLAPLPARSAAAPPAPASGGSGRARGARHVSAGATTSARDRTLQLAIEMNHRASMPASSGGKQVAIVQPQRRDTNEQTGNPSTPRSAPRRSKPDLDTSIESDSDKRKSRISPKTVPANTTKATLWIESRKSSPRRKHTPAPAPPARGVRMRMRRSMPANKSTPLRLAVLKKAQSARKVVKIEAPLKIDHTKQAAIMLMTGHTPKSRLSLNQPKKRSPGPSYLTKRPSPLRKSPPPRPSRQSGRSSKEAAGSVSPNLPLPTSSNNDSRRSSKRNSGNKSVTILEITDSDSRSTRASSVATRSSKSPQKSPLLPSPKKSALKDLSKKGNRKTESIKFDLSNLENQQDTEITSRFDSEESMSEDDLTLHYSESSERSPSPRKSINSRSNIILEKLGTTVSVSPSRSRTLTPNSPSSRKSARGSMLVQKALDNTNVSQYTTETSANTTVASAFKTRTLSPRTRNMESYSIVDLVSFDSDTSKSIYNSADSANTTDYETPNVSGRKTRSTINPTLIGSSTPYVAHARATRSRSNPNVSQRSTRSSASTSRRSKSLSTPENKHISVNSTRVSRASRSRSRINDSDLLLLDDTELEDSSPKTSRRSRTKSNANETSNVNDCINSPEKDGTSTPENQHSPVEVSTPVLSIQNLLDSSRSSLASLKSGKRGRKSVNYNRKTIGVLSEPRRRPVSKSKSLGTSARQTILRLSKDSSEISDRTDEGAPQPDNEDTVTPKSAVKLVQEAVKNKHSTAKKPLSKRSIIDDLNQSDIVKQLFNSPVKRKLSQSMTEFSRKQLFDDDEEIVIAKRATRNTTGAGRTLDDDITDCSGTFTPEIFVSPISTPTNSPNLSGIKRLFRKSTPENDLRDVRGVRSLLRTHRTRRSAKNDLTNVSGLKLVFAKSPRNRLSDVRVKEVFKASPDNDLRRVTGVKPLFQRESSPKNDLTDVRGVKKLFRKSPNNDLRNVSGVKRTLRNSPKNDLTDVRGVRKMFRHGKKKESLHDVSGVEELFDTSNRSNQNCENLFDQWVGKPTVRSVYSKTFSTKLIQKPKNRKGTLHNSLDVITNNVEEWLQHELHKRFHRDEPSTSKSRNASRNATKELSNLLTSTVEGDDPIRASRTRNSSMAKKSASEIYGAHTLPIKKRSLLESCSERDKPKLPIKKRAVVHSTPVKGRLSVHGHMHASELGRVSPIAPVDLTQADHDHDTSFTRATRQREVVTEGEGRSFRTKTPQKTPTKPIPKASPKKSDNQSKATPKTSANTTKATPKALVKTTKATPKASANTTKATPKASANTTKATPKASSQEYKASPKRTEKHSPKRITRNRNNTTAETNTKKRRSSLVISKKAPIMKPEADANTQEVSVTMPVKRTTRARKEQKVETPKRTRVRAQKATVVVVKPSPKLKPQATAKQLSQTEEKPRRTRKNTAVEAESQVKRGRGNDTKEPSVQEPRTRGKSVAKADKTDKKPPKTRGKQVETQISVESEPTTRRGRKNTEIVSLETKPKTRGKKQAEPVLRETKTRGKKVLDNVSLETQPKTKGKKQAEPAQNEPKTRGKKVEAQSSAQSEPATRGRRTAVVNTVLPETTGRKRKTDAVEEVPPKIAKTVSRRGRNAAETVEPVKATKAAAKDTAKTTRAAKDKPETKDVARTRGRPRKTEVEVVKPAPSTTTRGKKVPEPKASPVPDKRKKNTKASPLPNKRKRNVKASPLPNKRNKNTKAEASPMKGKEGAAPGVAAKRTRSAAQPESVASSGRSRRR